MQILRSTAATLTATFYTDETATNSSVAVTASVLRDNSTVLATSTATSGGSGIYTYNLSPQADLDILTVNWTGTINGVSQTLTTTVEIVDSFYASLPEIRDLQGLDDTDKFPLDALREARREAEALFESYTGRAFVPRYRRELHQGTGSTSLLLQNTDVRALLSITVDGASVATSAVEADESGNLVRIDGSTWPAPPSTDFLNVAVTYEYGFKYVPPEIKRAFLQYVRYKLLDLRNKDFDRMLSMSVDGQFYQMAQPGPNRATGLPDVDSVLNIYRRPRFNVGV